MQSFFFSSDTSGRSCPKEKVEIRKNDIVIKTLIQLPITANIGNCFLEAIVGACSNTYQ
jgi:hypothetical protein